MENNQRLQKTREYWDEAAARFDEEPDHGLRDPQVREAWKDLLRTALASYQGTLLDIGCGTGSLSVLLADLGFEVLGIDLSPEMIAAASAKVALSAHASIHFQVMDAAFPQFEAAQFDVIVCRHLLWALPEPEQVLQRWARLVKPGGRLCLIEGFWSTGSGLHASELVEMFPPSLVDVAVQNLSGQPALWGGMVNDERYVITANCSATLR